MNHKLAPVSLTVLEGWFVLVRWSIEHEHRQDVDVPHAIDTGEESAAVLDVVLVLAPLPVALIDLGEDEEDGSHDGADEGEDHEEAEAVDQPLPWKE